MTYQPFNCRPSLGKYLLSLLFCLPLLLSAQKNITLEDIWQKNTFNSKGIPGFNFQNDGVHYTRLAGAVMEQYDLRTGEKSGVLLDVTAIPAGAATGWAGSFDGYVFSGDESKLLLSCHTEQLYRRSSQSDFYVFDLKTKKLTRLHNGPKQRHPTFSPDGNMVAYVMENNLYYLDLQTNKTVQVTTDGQRNAIINGASDWVYEEEFELVRAFEWSPDGKMLAFLRFDETEVPEFTMEMHRGGAYPEGVTFKYPKVGEKNATVSAYFYEIATAETRPVTLPENKEVIDFYLPRLQWTPGKKLCLTWMNRLQNHEKLLLADPATGQCTTLHEVTNPAYIDLHEVHFLTDGSGFLKQSEKSGFNHLYRFDMKGQEKAAITKGNWDLTDLYGVDERNGRVFFQAAAITHMQREIYSVDMKGKIEKKSVPHRVPTAPVLVKLSTIQYAPFLRQTHHRNTKYATGTGRQHENWSKIRYSRVPRPSMAPCR